MVLLCLSFTAIPCPIFAQTRPTRESSAVGNSTARNLQRTLGVSTARSSNSQSAPETLVFLSVLESMVFSPSNDGKIEKLNIRQGDIVNAGDLLIDFDVKRLRFEKNRVSSEYDATTAVAENRGSIDSLNAQIEKKVNRLQLLEAIAARDDLKRLSPSPPLERYELRKDIEQLKGELAAEKGKLVEAEAQKSAKGSELDKAAYELELGTISAPYAGVIQSVSKREGDTVGRGEPISEIVRLDRLEAIFIFSITDVLPGEVIGRTYNVKIPQSADGKPWSTTVTISRVIPNLSEGENFRAFGEVANEKFVNSSGIEQWRLWPGMEAVGFLDASGTEEIPGTTGNRSKQRSDGPPDSSGNPNSRSAPSTKGSDAPRSNGVRRPSDIVLKQN